MASAPPVGVAVLAAGQSRRFGTADKLATEFRGKMLGLHAADTLAPLPFTKRWLIVRSEDQLIADGFGAVLNPDADKGMGTSLALAARLAEESGMTALLVALADMPLVPAEHFANMLEMASSGALLASYNGTAPTPPALFGRDHFATLASGSGDHGARRLIATAQIIPCDPDRLVDIDTPEALQRYA